MREEDKIYEIVNRQLSLYWGETECFYNFIEPALLRTKNCFSKAANKYYRDECNEIVFSPLHSGQYSIFLYYLSNTIFKLSKNRDLATKVYYLNKILHSNDWYFEIELPQFWGVEHPLGSVLGRANYSDGFFFYQGVTVGGNKGKYPTFGKNVILYSNATVIGDSVIGDNVLVSTGVTIKDSTIPSNSIVFGSSPNLIIKERHDNEVSKMMSVFWRDKE